MAKKHVIIGAGTAGINAIRTLRQSGSSDDIALVSAEAPYSRMVLPYVLEKGISESHATTLTPDQLEDWGVESHIGRRVTALDTAANKLTLDNGDDLEYDDLLIATGSSAVKLNIPGSDLEGVHSFWTMADARGLSAHIAQDSHVVMVGAGFIAFTILNGIMARAGSVTVVEVESRILPRMVNEASAEIIASRLESRGVTLRTGAALEKIEDAGGKKRLTFSGGETLEADVVVMATGIKTNLDWLDGSGITVNAGIVVDDHLRSNVPNVYAAGDVAEGANCINGAMEVHAIEPTAMEHGRIVGANMAGKDIAYAGSLMMNIVGVGGLDIASFGSWDDPDAEVIEAVNPQRPAYRKYLIKGDVMVGAIIVGASAESWSGNDIGMLKGMVQSGKPLGEWKAHLKAHPFQIKRPYLANKTVSELMPKTVLGQASQAPR